MTQQQSKPNYIQRANVNGIKGIPRASSSGDQENYTMESQSSPTIEVHTIKPGSQTDQFKKQRLTKRVLQTMGRQKKKNPQIKGKEGASERMLNEIE